MSRELPPVRLVNVVCTFCVNQNMDLTELTHKIPFAEFNAKKFAAASIRLFAPRSTCLVFSSGNLVVTGCTSEDHALLASYRYVNMLRKFLRLPLRMRKFRIQNLVAASTLSFNVDLVQMAEHYQLHCNYEPEIFPGLIFRVPGLVVLIFRSGRIVLTGAKNRKNIITAFEELYNDLLFPHSEHNALCVNSADYRVQQMHDFQLSTVAREIGSSAAHAAEPADADELGGE